MRDPRITKLANNLINQSVKAKQGERILIENTGIEPELIKALVEETYAAGAQPFVWLKDPSLQRALMMGLSEDQANIIAENEAALMSKMDGYVGVRSGTNSSELSDVPSDKSQIYAKYVWKKVHSEIRVPKTRWVVLRYPNPSMAQSANMSTESFEEFYFNVCCLDYEKMDKAMDALVERMERTDKVRLVGNGTDISFSIKGMEAIKCSGEVNIPDGEVFTAPVRDSVNGVIAYNTPSLHDGFCFEKIRFTFKDGKIINAEANDVEKINKILDTDPGARYVGEFAIGVNPYINHAMKDTLFDEKIAGSIHFTPGACYDECDNKNKSAVHWDLVLIQTPEYGGGEIWFDDELIRKDGLFVPESLHCLNPDALK